jgi:hypothetical protein
MKQEWRERWLRIKTRMISILHGDAFLCDSCQLNYGTACVRPERPNAKSCPDYVKK